MNKKEESNGLLILKFLVLIIAIIVGAYLSFTNLFSLAGRLLMYMGVILIIALFRQAKMKKILSDELSRWISAQATSIAFWITVVLIVIIISLNDYYPNRFETYSTLGGVLIFMLLVYLFSYIYYLKIKKVKGF